MKTKIVLLMIVTILLLAVSCSKTQSCAELTKEYRDQVKQLADKWDSANSLANNSPRSQLVIAISKLQDVRGEYKILIVPECAQNSHASMLKYMDATIDGFTSFLAQEDDSIVNNHFTEAGQYFDAWEIEFANLSIAPTP